MLDDDEPDRLFSTEKVPTMYSPPRATTNYIQLRFQLARFQVYRIVQLPLTFTFANLHTLIQYMFGWSDSHLHHAEVYLNVVLHEEAQLLGTIKSCGSKRTLEDWELTDPGALDDWSRFSPADKPIYRVQPTIRSRRDSIDRIMLMEEKGLTLESIWTEMNNISDGACSHSEVAIIYTYDLCEDWNVHITCDQADVSDIFYRLDAPNNIPTFKQAQGAPPIEHATWDADMSLERDAEEKTVSPRLFDVAYFQGYCEGKVISEARKSKLSIITLKEAKKQYREQLRRKKEKEERIANGELEENEMDVDEDSEYDSVD